MICLDSRANTIKCRFCRWGIWAFSKMEICVLFFLWQTRVSFRGLLIRIFTYVYYLYSRLAKALRFFMLIFQFSKMCIPPPPTLPTVKERNMNKINTEKMSDLGKEFIELALKIEDLKKQQTHNKNMAKVIPGGKYAQLPLKEIEEEIGHRISQLPLLARHGLLSLWLPGDNDVYDFQVWYIIHTHKHPQDRKALNELWYKICLDKIPNIFVSHFYSKPADADEFIYRNRMYDRRDKEELHSFRRNILKDMADL